MKKIVELKKVLELMAVDIVRSGKFPSLPVDDPLYKDIKGVDITDGIVPLSTQKAYVEAILPCMIRMNAEVFSLPCEPAEPDPSIFFRYGSYFVLYSVLEPWVDDLCTTEIHIKDVRTYSDLKKFIEELKGIDKLSVYALVDLQYRKVDFKADYNVYTRKWSNFSIPLFEQ